MKRILIIQQKMIGDVLISTFMCELIKKEHPDIIVDYLINEHTFPVVKGNPYIDNIILLRNKDEKTLFSLFKFAQKQEVYDLVIDAYSKLQSNLISFFIKSKKKVSFYKWYTKVIYSDTFKSLSYDENGAIKDRLDLLNFALKSNLRIQKPKIHLSEEELLKGKEFLIKNGIQPKETVFMIGVLGSCEAKTYPLEYMAKVIDTVAENSDAKFLFNYIPSQIAQAKAVYDLCKPTTQKRIIIDAYTKSLRDFLAVLKHCKALIGNEGGAVNMAKALEIPTFSIYSPQINKEAWNTFSDDKNVGVHLKDYKSILFEGKLDYKKMYYFFKLELFKDDLLVYLKLNI